MATAITAVGRGKASSETISASLRRHFSALGREAATAAHLTLLATCYERPFPNPVQELYLACLAELTEEQAITALSRATLEESRFFPPPARLRELGGCETENSRSEREAQDGLQWVLWRIRKHGTEGRPARGAMIRDATREHQAVYESIPCPTTPEPIRNTLEELGAGNVQAGVTLMAMHPLLDRDPDAYDNLSFRLSATEKLEQRWLEAWRRANRGKR